MTYIYTMKLRFRKDKEPVIITEYEFSIIKTIQDTIKVKIITN